MIKMIRPPSSPPLYDVRFHTRRHFPLSLTRGSSPRTFLSKVPFRTFVPHSVLHASTPRVKIASWSKEVSSTTTCLPGRCVVYPLVIWYDLDNDKIYENDAIDCGQATFNIPELEDNRVSSVHHTNPLFVIVQVYGSFRKFNPSSNDPTPHVVTVYLHRATYEAPWRAVVCDPNWNRVSAYALHNVVLMQLGMHVVRRIGKTHAPPLPIVALHRCINVNTCLPAATVRDGVCFTGICATLIATALHIRHGSSTVPTNGNELMQAILTACHVFRNRAAQLVASYHSGADAEYLERLYKKSATAKHSSRRAERSRSPVFIGKKTTRAQEATAAESDASAALMKFL